MGRIKRRRTILAPKSDFCNTKITIYKLSHDINSDNEWVEHMVKWKELWADVAQTFIKGRVPYYKFEIRANVTMPDDTFLIGMNDMLFKTTTPPFRSLDKSRIVFSATQVSKVSMKGYLQNADV